MVAQTGGMHEPLILNDRQLLLDHHARLAVVEAETRECRADVAELRGAIDGVRTGVEGVRTAVGDLASTVQPLVAGAAARHQQTSSLLLYTFSACLGIGGGSLSAWLSALAHLAGAAQALIPVGAGLLCILLARVVIAHSHQ